MKSKYTISTIALTLGLSTAMAQKYDQYDMNYQDRTPDSNIQEKEVGMPERQDLSEKINEAQEENASTYTRAESYKTSDTLTANDFIGSQFSEKIIFPYDNTELTVNQQEQLKRVVARAKKAGDIDEVHLAVWSNKPYPTKENEKKVKLTEKDEELAQKRISSITDYLKENFNVDKVNSYNMGDEASEVSKLYNTSEAELKTLFAKEGQQGARIDKQSFERIKQIGEPSSAVLIIQTNTDKGYYQGNQKNENLTE